MGKAVACLERAKAAGEFTPKHVRWFTESADLAPVRGKFDPPKK